MTRPNHSPASRCMLTGAGFPHLGRMKIKAYLLLLALLGMVLGAHSQSMSPPNPVGKDQILKMVSGLTKGMPEQAAEALLTNQGLHCSYILSSTNARIYRYHFTNGWFEF